MPTIGTPMAPAIPMAPNLANGTAGMGAQIFADPEPHIRQRAVARERSEDARACEAVAES